MALSEQISCDICGVIKQQANHWVLWNKASDSNTVIYFSPWDIDYKLSGHLCGESCAHKMLAKAIEDWGKRSDEQ